CNAKKIFGKGSSEKVPAKKIVGNATRDFASCQKIFGIDRDKTYLPIPTLGWPPAKTKVLSPTLGWADEKMQHPFPTLGMGGEKFSTLIFNELQTLIYPIGYEHIGVARAAIVAVAAEGYFFAVRREHHKRVKLLVVSDLL